MADVVKVKVEGIKEAVAALDRLEKKARRRAVTAGVNAGNRLLRTRARTEAPMKTGALRKSINASVRLDRATGTVTGTIYAGKATKGMVKRGQTAYYAHMVHGGTKPHEMRTKKHVMVNGNIVRMNWTHPGAKANAFFDRTINAMWNAAIDAFTTAFGAKVEEELR